jgi:endonuclease III
MTRRASSDGATRKRTLRAIRSQLEGLYGPWSDPAPGDPFHLILWEQVGYLADDERRLHAFRLLEERVGLGPQDLVRAAPETLVEIAAAGGSIAAEERAERMRSSAVHVIERWSGDLRGALALPLPEALRALRRFPMIGKPGAEKILLFTRTHPLLALDSNGLRVLLRLGYGREGRSYAQSYESVRAATGPEQRADYDWLVSLHGLLRMHGQRLCRRNEPRCGECPLLGCCDYGRSRT